jgi:hypothetical protein
MEPDKTYPLHSDRDDHVVTPKVPPVNTTNVPLEPPSSFDHRGDEPVSRPTSVPWYLQPLTKTTQAPLTSTQTRPYVPRAPLPSAPIAQSPPPRAPLPPQVPKPFSQFGAVPGKATPADHSTEKAHRLRSIIGIGIILLIIGMLGTGAYQVLWNNHPDNSVVLPQPDEAKVVEARLHQALDRHLRTQYVRQVYDQKAQGEATGALTLDTVSDFSDPASPKSHIRYDVQAGTGENAIKESGEIMVLDEKDYFGKLSAPALSNQGTDAVKPKVGQWYKVSNTDSTGETLVDPLSARTGLNSSLGEIPIGNFNESTHRELMQFITERNVYAIQSSKEVTEGAKKLTLYMIKFNPELVNELNKKIAEKIDRADMQSLVSFGQNDVKDMKVWVDNISGRITRVAFKREYTRAADAPKPLPETITISLSYPANSMDIYTPEDAISGSW